MQPRKVLAVTALLTSGALAAAGCGSSSPGASSTGAKTSGNSAATTSGNSASGDSASGGSGSGTSGNGAVASASSVTTPAAGSGKGKTLALIEGTDADPFYITMSCGAKAEAAKLGAKITVQGPPTFSAPQQIPIVNSVTASHPNAVLIAPTDDQALIAPMKQMKQAGITLVEVDTTVKDNSLAVSAISSNNYYGGELAARTLAKLVGDKGSVVVINEQPGISTTDARAQGFAAGMKAYPHIKVLSVQYDQDNANTAASLVSSELAAHPNLSGIFAINTLTAGGVGTGLRQAHAQGRVKVVGFDAEPQEIQQLNSGVVDALIVQQPALEGKVGVEEAIDALDHKPVTKKIGTKLVAITKANLSSMRSYVYKSSCS